MRTEKYVNFQGFFDIMVTTLLWEIAALCMVEAQATKGKKKLVEIYIPLPEDKILDRSKLKQSVDDNFKFDENSRQFCKQVENTVGKGEIARYEQFLLFPQCFQKVCFPEASKHVTIREWVRATMH